MGNRWKVRVNSELEARDSRVSGAPSECAVYGLPASLGPRTPTGKNLGIEGCSRFTGKAPSRTAASGILIPLGVLGIRRPQDVRGSRAGTSQG